MTDAGKLERLADYPGKSDIWLAIKEASIPITHDDCLRMAKRLRALDKMLTDSHELFTGTLMKYYPDLKGPDDA